MKHLIFLLLTLCTRSAYGQDQTTDSSTTGFDKFKIGINVSPDICFRTLKTNDASSSSEFVLKLDNELDRIKIGYTAGLNVCFNIRRFVSLETGIQYSNKGYQTKFIDLIPVQPDPIDLKKARTVYNFHCIDIPVKANFFIGKKKVRFFASIGVTTNFFFKVTQTNILVYADHTEKKTNPSSFDYNKVNISPTISLGIDYRISRRMNLRIEPIFRYGVLKIIDAPVTGYLYNGGLNVSYYVGF